MKLHRRIEAVEEIVGHHFEDSSLVVSAITHPSAAEGKAPSASYERLEFLGDAVLGAIVAHEVYQKFPSMDEGQLTDLKIALVSGKMLSAVSESLGLADLILFGVSELGTHTRGMRSALEDVFESLVGALYEDAGYDVARDFVMRHLGEYMVPETIQLSVNPKTRLQEITQSGNMHMTPTYKLEGSEGPAHAKVFTSVALLEGRRVGRGKGRSKKESESAAAADAIRRIEEDPHAAWADIG
ncbi:MAG: ribonuclease III [Atopobiaceae bacterium]|nr:ribonuclease III [Atopobiaceae bacterium]